jgi:site-specific recombinase XerD
MQHARIERIILDEFQSDYDSYLLNRGLSHQTLKLHQFVLRRFFRWRFPTTHIRFSDLRFDDFVQFVTTEFGRLHHRESQRVWLMVLRSLLRFLAQQGHVPAGWDSALPGIAHYQHAQLPRHLTQNQVRALLKASTGNKPSNLRDRALLLLFLRLGLRLGEVANLRPHDIDWRRGTITVRGTKSHRERVLPLPRDVGNALVAHLRTQQAHSEHIFHPKRPPFTEVRCRIHVLNSQRYLFQSAGITDRGSHALRHTLATQMVNSGVSFKAVADVLGHKSVTTTLIYAKLDLKALEQVAMPWPGGAR